jgi:hypothetical protein
MKDALRLLCGVQPSTAIHWHDVSSFFFPKCMESLTKDLSKQVSTRILVGLSWKTSCPTEAISSKDPGTGRHDHNVFSQRKQRFTTTSSSWSGQKITLLDSRMTSGQPECILFLCSAQDGGHGLWDPVEPWSRSRHTNFMAESNVSSNMSNMC